MTLIGSSSAYDSKGLEIKIGDWAQTIPKRSNGFLDAFGEVSKIELKGDIVLVSIDSDSGPIVVDTDDVQLLI